MSDETFLAGLATLLTVWPRRAPDAATVAALSRVYRAALADLSDAAWATAVAAAVSTCVHFPTPAELRSLSRTGQPAPPVEAGITAWIRRHPQQARRLFGPVVRAVLRRGDGRNPSWSGEEQPV